MDHDGITRLALTQHGLVTRRQALDLGGSTQQIRTLVASGRWTAVRRGVFAVGAPPQTWERSVMAGCLAAGERVPASHRTAARLWGSVERSGRIELLSADQRLVRLASVQVHRTLILPDLDLAVVCGIPTTAVARTLVDLAPGQDPLVIGRWIDDAMRRLGLDLLELRSCIARLAGPGRPSAPGLDAALAKRLVGYDPGDSDLEARALEILGAAGLPAPVLQHRVVRPNGRDAFIDLAYPPALVGIDLDGWEHHGGRTAFDQDRERRNDLTLLGWQIYQFTSTTTARSLVQVVTRALGISVQ